MRGEDEEKGKEVLSDDGGSQNDGWVRTKTWGFEGMGENKDVRLRLRKRKRGMRKMRRLRG